MYKLIAKLILKFPSVCQYIVERRDADEVEQWIDDQSGWR